MYLVLSSQEIIQNWESILNDRYNSRPDIKDPYRFIHECRTGVVTAGGAQIIICDKLPEFK